MFFSSFSTAATAVVVVVVVAAEVTQKQSLGSTTSSRFVVAFRRDRLRRGYFDSPARASEPLASNRHGVELAFAESGRAESVRDDGDHDEQRGPFEITSVRRTVVIVTVVWNRERSSSSDDDDEHDDDEWDRDATAAVSRQEGETEIDEQ